MSLTPTPATGARVLFGLARETNGYNEGGSEALEFFRPILPLGIGLVPSEVDPGLILSTQVAAPSFPGPVTGAVDLTCRAAPRDLVPFLDHLLGGCTKANPTAGVYSYTFVWDADLATSSFWAFRSVPPVDRQYFYGIKFGKIDLNFAANAPINAKLAGFASQGSRLDLVQDSAVTGTYSLGPWLRGPLANAAGGKVWVKIVAVTNGTSTNTTFKVVQKATVPDAGEWSAAATRTVYVPSSSGVGEWQDTGLGTFSGTNKDLNEILFPGTKPDHTDLAADDIFVFDSTIADPAPSYASSLDSGFGLAHLQISARGLGDSEWSEFGITGGGLSLEAPVTPRTGNGSNYYQALDRSSIFRPSATLTRGFYDRRFDDWRSQHKRFELRHLLQGPVIGSTTHHHQVEITWASASVSAQAAQVQNAAIVSETVTLVGEGNDNGDDPITIVVTTDRNYTPFADL